MTEIPPEQAAIAPRPDHPVQLVADDDRKRSRLTVLFRLFLAIPHFFWLWLWLIAAAVILIIGWFAALILGRLPNWAHEFLARFEVYLTHFTAYTNLLANPYPRFLGEPGSYVVDLRIAPAEPQPRWKTLLRIFLAIPALLFTFVFQQVLSIIAFIGWFVCLAIGRMPKGMEDLGLYCLRYQQQTYCYVSLLTARYPSLSAPIQS